MSFSNTDKKGCAFNHMSFSNTGKKNE